MLQKPLEAIGFGLKAEVDAQFNLSYKHLEELKKVHPLFESNLMKILEECPLSTTVEKLNSQVFEVPELTEEQKKD